MPLLVCSIVSCAGLKKFPTERVWEYDRKAQVCGEYEILDYDPRLRFRHVRDVPLSQCPAIFGFTSSDIPKILNWAEDAVAYGKRRCE